MFRARFMSTLQPRVGGVLASAHPRARAFGVSAIAREYMDVHGKTAIITGAGSGINLSFAKLLLSKSCNVVIADLSMTPQAEALLTEKHPGGAKAVFKKTDVVDWKQLREIFTFAREQGLGECGAVDIVVPGAGVFEPDWSSFFGGDTVGEADSRYRSLDINLTHPIKLTRLAITEFLTAKKPSAAVILVSSIAGQRALLNTPIYVAAKHGISGFTRSLGELEPRFNIRVSAVAPGVIKTPLWTEHPEKRKMVDEIKDEWATPEEVADGMLMLLERTDLPGGTVLEVGRAQRRIVNAFNDPGPSGAGHSVSNAAAVTEDILDILKAESGGRRV